MAKPSTESKPGPNDVVARPMRETIESIVIAFVLAFLFRTFEAEAFVIPTGSMAPTLQGQHKEIKCPKCGYWYKSGASGGAGDDDQATLVKVDEATCPICRYPFELSSDPQLAEKNPNYTGDRILVGKFPYDFGEPDRFDVFVFKCPYDARTNYIKRLIGLPNETIRIRHGDIYIAKNDAKGEKKGVADFHIARKAPRKLQAMMQLVHDNDFIPQDLVKAGYPLRWQAWPPTAGEKPAGAWTSDDDGHSFAIDNVSGKSGEQWIRYQHFVPQRADWTPQEYRGRRPPPRPSLITDHYAYNDDRLEGRMEQLQREGTNWVGDLAVECEVDVESDSGVVTLELIRAGRHFQANFDIKAGTVQLAIDGVKDFKPTAATALRGPGKHTVELANCDQQLTVWVDNSPIAFDAPTTYDGALLGRDAPVSTAEEAGDLAPARVGAQDAKVRVTHLRVWRDVYYIAVKSPQRDAPQGQAMISEYLGERGRHISLRDRDAVEFFSNPSLWNGSDPNYPNFDRRDQVDFPLGDDQFFPLGDNSPQSKDGRLWASEHYDVYYVDRSLLIGKALYIYWPHAWPTRYSFKLPLPAGFDFDIPFYPYFGRMGFVR